MTTLPTFPPLPWLKHLRPQQESAIADIVAAFEDGVRVVVLDAPTGSGKTLIAEFVRRALDDRTLYVCSSLSLQDQFVRDFPFAALLKGRANYQPFDEQSLGEPVTCADCDIGKKQSCATCRGSGTFLGVLDDEDKHCSLCHPPGMCPYKRARRAALVAPLACVNTAYFLTEANYVGGFSDVPLVIVDECDTLEATLLNFATIEITERAQENWGVLRPGAQSGPKLVEWVERTALRLKTRLDTMIEMDDANALTIRERRDMGHLQSLCRKFEGLRMGLDAGEWLCTSTGPKIIFKPTTVKGLGQEWLWQHGQRWLFMSASVLDAGELLGSVGYTPEIGRVACVEVESTFPPENRPIVVQPIAKMTYTHLEKSKPLMAKAILDIMEAHPDERILIHTWTYALTKYFSENLPSQRLLAYLHANQREAALNAFKFMDNAVLLASSFARGVDLKDDLCRVIIIPKIPYVGLDDVQVKARMAEPDGQTWYTVQTARTILQMTGRGVRHETDTCITYILDAQFSTFWQQAKLLFPDYWKAALQWR